MNAGAISAFLLRHPEWTLLPAYLLGSIRLSGFSIFARIEPDVGSTVRPGRSEKERTEQFVRRAGLTMRLGAFFLNAGKGYLAVWLTAHFTQANIHWMMYAALCAILGDMFPIWRGFRGGRGIATAAGAFLGICGPAVAIAFSVWLLVLWFWDYVSLASISAAAAFPMLMYLLYAPRHAPPEVVSFGTLLASALAIMRHSTNIQRLLSGTEPRFHPGKSEDEPKE